METMNTNQIYNALIALIEVHHFIYDLERNPRCAVWNCDGEDYPETISVHDNDGQVILYLTAETPERFLVKSHDFDENELDFSDPMQAVEAFKVRYEALKCE